MKSKLIEKLKIQAEIWEAQALEWQIESDNQIDKYLKYAAKEHSTVLYNCSRIILEILKVYE